MHYGIKDSNRPFCPNHNVPPSRAYHDHRQAKPEDLTPSIPIKTFPDAKVSDGDEQDFVLKRRSEGRYIPSWNVAEEDGVLIGHIMAGRHP